MGQPLIVSASGIRGVVGSGLQPEIAARYGAAYGQFVGKTAVAGGGSEDGGEVAGGRVLLARDSRTSGPVLAQAVAAGLRAAGRNVADAGVLPTPTALLAVADDDRLHGGVIVTASHNPADWNGLKLAGAGGEFLTREEGTAVQELYERGPAYASWEALGGEVDHVGAAQHHVERILALDLVDGEGIADAGLTVAVDAAGGAGGPLMEELLDRLGCTVLGLHMEPDGSFPRPPEPSPEHLRELAQLVRDRGADVGMALDPDGDRLALVDDRGHPPGEDWTLALAAEYVLQARSGPLVTNLSSSRVITDAAERAGASWHLAPVGETNVAGAMREVDAAIGGEGNGGVMLPDLHLTRDGPLAAALVLGLLAESGRSLSDVVSESPGYHIVKRRAPRPEEGLGAVYRRLREEAPGGWTEDGQDGLRLDWSEEGRWLHVRPSGTEPIVRVVAEARDARGAEELARWATETVEEFASASGGR